MNFINEIYEARMTRDLSGLRNLTYTDCCERLYITLLVLETMRNFEGFNKTVSDYARKTTGNRTYSQFRSSGTDLYNFIYFVVGNEETLSKLKDPDAAIKLRSNTKLSINKLNDYLANLATGTQPTGVSNFFIKIEQELGISNTDYKLIRRSLSNLPNLSTYERAQMATKLIYAVRARLRNSDIIEDFEKWALIKDAEVPGVPDTEPTISVPDIQTDTGNIALYRYIVGSGNLFQTKNFIEHALQQKTIPSSYVEGYLPIIKLVDDIVQAGPSFIQSLRVLHNRAKNHR